METYYDRLKLPVNASDNEIKMQYRRLAKGCHPDLNPDNPKAAEQFRELHKAYTVLSDPEKRKAYDSSLSHFDRGTNSYTYRYSSATQPRPHTQRRRTAPRRPMFKPDKPRQSFFNYEVGLSIQELFKGARRKLTIGQTHTCPRCRGKGVLVSGEKCPRCEGYTFLVSYEQAEIVIPPGVLPGTMIRVEVGHNYSANPMFDVLYIDEVLVTVIVKQDEPFTVREQHLYTTVHVPAALLEEGGKWELPAPEGGEVLVMNIPPKTSSGTTLTLRRHGLKNGASQRRGNLYCTLLSE
jgi:molecular chaperone DnaJ